MPPTRFGHIRISSIQPGAAAQASSRPMTSSGTAAVPWLSISAPIRNRLWLLPPIPAGNVRRGITGCARSHPPFG